MGRNRRVRATTMITIEQIKQQEQIKDQAQQKAKEERDKWFLMIAQYNKENEVQYEQIRNN